MNIRAFFIGAFFCLIVVGTAADQGCAQDKYHAIDQLALNVPVSLENSIETLANYFDHDSLSNREKTRAVYRWITDRIEYDIDAFLTGWPAAVNPNAVFVSRETTCGGYTSLFCSLLNELEIPCKMIEGYAKSFPSFEVDTLNNVNNHAWNAVFLENKWWMSDLTFSVGTYDLVNKKFIKNFNDGYFLVKPERFIYNHFPFDPENQFLEEPVTFEQFAHFPSVSRYFFDYNIDFLELPPGKIKASKTLSLSLTNTDSSIVGVLLEPASDNLNHYYAQTSEIYKKIYALGLNFDLTHHDNRVTIKMKFHEKRPYLLYCFGRYKEQPTNDYRALVVVKIENREAASVDEDVLNYLQQLELD